MKGLVLAGGAGTRLRPLTHTGAKQLVPVANRPMLFYVIDNLVDAGHSRYRRDHLARDGRARSARRSATARAGARDSRTFLQDRPAGSRTRSPTARPFLGGDGLLHVPRRQPDWHHDPRRGRDVPRLDPSCAASVMLKEVPNPRRFGVAEVDDAGNVVRLVEKPKEPKSNLALVGIYIFRACHLRSHRPDPALGARRARDHRRHQQAHRAGRQRAVRARSLRGGSTPARRTTCCSRTTPCSTIG